MDEPGERSAHGNKTPTLGGVGIYIAFTFTIIFFSILLGLPQSDLIVLLALIAASMLLLFLGVKDDLIALSPRKKFIGQIIAASLVVFVADIRIISFQGLFNIEVLPYFLSVIISIFVFLVVINAYNLIDGIDGLAGITSIVCSLFFGVYYILNGDLLMLMVSTIMIGCMLGFLQFNLSVKNKLFMGDSGSMFTGFILIFQTIYFIESGIDYEYVLPNAPVLAVAILSYPALDALRVMTIRIARRRNPFKGDQNHIHHRILKLGFSHKETSLMIGASNLAIIVFTILLGNLELGMTNQLFLVIAFVPLFYLHSLLIGRFGKKSAHEEAYEASYLKNGDGLNYSSKLALDSNEVQLGSFPYPGDKKDLSIHSNSVVMNQQDTKLSELQQKRIQEFDTFKEKADKIRSIKKA